MALRFEIRNDRSRYVLDLRLSVGTHGASNCSLAPQELHLSPTFPVSGCLVRSKKI